MTFAPAALHSQLSTRGRRILTHSNLAGRHNRESREAAAGRKTSRNGYAVELFPDADPRRAWMRTDRLMAMLSGFFGLLAALAWPWQDSTAWFLHGGAAPQRNRHSASVRPGCAARPGVWAW